MTLIFFVFNSYYKVEGTCEKEKNMLMEMTLRDILNELSSEKPVPGGGTASALAGAFSAAMVDMVCNLTIGKKRYVKYDDEMKKVREKATKLREEFLLLAEKDAEVFAEVMKAYQMPRETEEEKQVRKAAVQEATKRAALVPMDVLRRCAMLTELSLKIALHGNVNSISDSGVAAVLAHAAARGASLNILINLSTITDEDFVGKLKAEQQKVLKTVEDQTNETLQVVQSKL